MDSPCHFSLSLSLQSDTDTHPPAPPRSAVAAGRRSRRRRHSRRRRRRRPVPSREHVGEEAVQLALHLVKSQNQTESTHDPICGKRAQPALLGRARAAGAERALRRGAALGVTPRVTVATDRPAARIRNK